nr:MAG TPA: hypothetical protein [Caudoviricetes sp.]
MCIRCRAVPRQADTAAPLIRQTGLLFPLSLFSVLP